MEIVVGATAAIVLLGGAWYTATLRAQNTVLREQIASYERASAASQVHAAPAAKST